MTAPLKHAQMSLGPADVLALLMPSYWTRAGLNQIAATRYCAIVALLSCCHLSLFVQRKIRISDWRPGGQDLVIVGRFGRRQEVPLTPQAVYVVERYLKERERERERAGAPLRGDDYLFVNRQGKQPFAGQMVTTFRRVERGAGFHRPLQQLLLRFCAKNLEKSGDRTMSRRFRGYSKKPGSPQIELPAVPIEKLARFVRSTNPMKTLHCQIRSEMQAARYLSKKDTVVPKTLARKRCTLPLDEPVVAELMAVEWPKARRARRTLTAQLRAEHGAAIEALLARGLITFELAAPLFGVSHAAFEKFHHNHHRRAEPPRRFLLATRPEAPPKAKVSSEEKVIINLLKGIRWPKDKVLAKAKSRELILEHYAAVHDMISRRLLTTFRAAKLFGISQRKLLNLRAAISAGQSIDKAIAERSYGRVPDEWFARLRDEHEKRPKGETDIAFCFRMQAAGFPACRDQFSIHLRRLKAAATMSQQAKELIRTLTSVEWPADANEANARRRELLLAHFDEVDALLDARKLAQRDVAELFKVPTATIEYIRSARRAGLPLQAAVDKTRRAFVPETMWVKMGEEHERSPREKDRSFFFRMCLEHGFPGSEKQMVLFRLRLRKEAVARCVGSGGSLAAAA